MTNTPEQLTLKTNKLTRNQVYIILSAAAVLGVIGAVFTGTMGTPDFQANIQRIEQARVEMNAQLDRQQCETEKSFCRYKLTQPDDYNQDDLIGCATKAKMECSFTKDRK